MWLQHVNHVQLVVLYGVIPLQHLSFHGDPPVRRFPVDVFAGGFDSITDEMMEGYKEPGRPRCNRPVTRPGKLTKSYGKIHHF